MAQVRHNEEAARTGLAILYIADLHGGINPTREG
jgi:hypothetical protein